MEVGPGRKDQGLDTSRPQAVAPGARQVALANVERALFVGGGSMVAAGLVLKFIPKIIVAFGLVGVILGVMLLVVRRLSQSGTAQAQGQREAERERWEAARNRFAEAKKALYSVEASSPARPFATRALAQIESVLDLEKTFSGLLASKFEAGELTQERYAATAGNAIEALNANILECSQRIRRAVVADPAIEALLAANDQALAALASVNGALASIRTTKEGSTASLDAAITDLTDLAARAKLYDGRE